MSDLSTVRFYILAVQPGHALPAGGSRDELQFRLIKKSYGGWVAAPPGWRLFYA
jgi:hypothetical protein